MKRNLSKWFSLAAFVLCVPGAHALSTDRDQPINIEADQAEADDIEGITVYRGDVVIIQGSLKITGDLVTIYFDENQEMKKMVADGKPATFTQKPDGPDPVQNAEASTLEFYAAEDTIVLIGDAHSWQGENSIRAQQIVYDTRRGRVKADSVRSAASDSGTDKQRVKITIGPKAPAPPPE